MAALLCRSNKLPMAARQAAPARLLVPARPVARGTVAKAQPERQQQEAQPAATLMPALTVSAASLLMALPAGAAEEPGRLFDCKIGRTWPSPRW